MPRRTTIDLEQALPLLHFERSKERRVEVTMALERAVVSGIPIVLEESSFSDPGKDYSALYAGSEQVLYIAGY